MSLETRWNTVMMANYGTPPIAIERGDGVRVWDDTGREYLDFVGGIAVSSLGHAHPAIVSAVSAQVARLAHSSNLAIHEPGVTLAERLVALLDLPGRVFFANSGAEANECAIKLARRHRPGKTIVSCNSSFHGRTMGALSLTGNPPKRTPFEPLPGPVTFVDYGDIEAMRNAVTQDTAAVFVEPRSIRSVSKYGNTEGLLYPSFSSPFAKTAVSEWTLCAMRLSPPGPW